MPAPHQRGTAPMACDGAGIPVNDLAVADAADASRSTDHARAGA
jgi:hypothetical protein